MINGLCLDRLFLRKLYGFESPDETGDKFRFGIEEEYFLADSKTGNPAGKTPDSLFVSAGSATEGLVAREFLQTQAEAVLPPYTRAEDALHELRYIRRVLSAMASEHGLSVLACGTRPTANWQESVRSEGDRYRDVMDDLQMVGERRRCRGPRLRRGHDEMPGHTRRGHVRGRSNGHFLADE